VIRPHARTAPISTESNLLVGAVEIDGLREERFSMLPGVAGERHGSDRRNHPDTPPSEGICLTLEQ
jgi:hypothetical protein